MWKIVKKKMENMSPFKYILSNQLVMKIYLYVCKDGNFLSPLIKLNVDMVFTQILLHMDHIGKKFHAHQACSGHD